MTLPPEVYKNTEIALNGLFSNSEMTQNHIRKNHGYHYTPKQLLNEFCTIKLCSSRQSGHSTSLMNLAINKLQSVIFVYPNLKMANRYREVAKSLIGEHNISRDNNQFMDFVGIDSIFSRRFIWCSIESLERLRGIDFSLKVSQLSFSINTDPRMTNPLLPINAICVDCSCFLKHDQRELICHFGDLMVENAMENNFNAYLIMVQ
jgi:hypothetical protein